MWPFKKKVEKISGENIARDISIFSAYGSNRFKEILLLFSKPIEPLEFMFIYLEFNIFLLHIIDKMASRYHGTLFRNEIINEITSYVKNTFVTVEMFDVIDVDKNQLFERSFQEVFYNYPRVGSVLGDDDTQVAIYFTDRLIETILENDTEEFKILVREYVYKMLESFIVEVLSIDSIKKIVT